MIPYDNSGCPFQKPSRLAKCPSGGVSWHAAWTSPSNKPSSGKKRKRLRSSLHPQHAASAVRTEPHQPKQPQQHHRGCVSAPKQNNKPCTQKAGRLLSNRGGRWTACAWSRINTRTLHPCRFLDQRLDSCFSNMGTGKGVWARPTLKDDCQPLTRDFDVSHAVGTSVDCIPPFAKNKILVCQGSPPTSWGSALPFWGFLLRRQLSKHPAAAKSILKSGA